MSYDINEDIEGTRVLPDREADGMVVITRVTPTTTRTSADADGELYGRVPTAGPGSGRLPREPPVSVCPTRRISIADPTRCSSASSIAAAGDGSGTRRHARAHRAGVSVGLRGRAPFV